MRSPPSSPSAPPLKKQKKEKKHKKDEKKKKHKKKHKKEKKSHSRERDEDAKNVVADDAVRDSDSMVHCNTKSDVTIFATDSAINDATGGKNGNGNQPRSYVPSAAPPPATNAEENKKSKKESTSLNPSSSNNSDKKRRKRKRSTTTTTIGGNDDESNNKIFNGLILAISTLESKNEDSNPDASTETDETNKTNNNWNHLNYKTLSQTLTNNLGCSALSPQIHKRLHYLIATTPAITHLTQRVRQAFKRNVNIVHVDWVKECVEQGRRLDVKEEYLWNERVGCLIKEKERLKKEEDEKKLRQNQQQKNTKEKSNNKEGYDHDADDWNGGDDDINVYGDKDDIPDDDNMGWSSPIQLDCCCVCHENGDDNCPWCGECNLTLARKCKNESR